MEQEERPLTEDSYQFSVSVLFTYSQLKEIFGDLGDPAPTMPQKPDGGTETHGTSCDGGTCQIDR
jgi:hypothetical protein